LLTRIAKLSTANAVALLVALTLLFAVSCARRNSASSPEGSPRTRVVSDDSGRRITVPSRVDRIVSLAPNLTEIVYAVGAGDRLVGDTSYCDYPPAAQQVAKVGDTLHPSVERIIALHPQVVLVSTASQLEAFTRALEEHQIAVYVTDPHDLEGVFRSVQELGDLFGEGARAANLVDSLRARTAAVESAVRERKLVRVFYQVSGQPLYTAGRESWLTDLIRRAGGISVTAEVPGAWLRYSDEAAVASKPDAIILPTGGSMGSANSDVAASLKRSPAAVAGRVYKINDDHLSRPGPRLVDGLEELARALHPEAFR
jgi:iron complex transport system substrate-binding protein